MHHALSQRVVWRERSTRELGIACNRDPIDSPRLIATCSMAREVNERDRHRRIRVQAARLQISTVVEAVASASRLHTGLPTKLNHHSIVATFGARTMVSKRYCNRAFLTPGSSSTLPSACPRSRHARPEPVPPPQGIEGHETLQARAIVGQLADTIKHEITYFLTDGVVPRST